MVSVSLFGAGKKYLSGSKRLAKSVKQNLPDWKLVFFIGKSVPIKTQEELKKLGCELIPINEVENLASTAWRFRISHLGRPSWVIFRDSDSIISKREANAIGQWITSGLDAHIIRDHPFHSAKVLAGLWGLKTSSTEWFEREVGNFDFGDYYGSDQDFLAKHVYPTIRDNSLVHASFHKHETGENTAEFMIGSSRFGVFCGESQTSTLIERLYARLRRVTDSKSCKCER